MQVPKWPSHTPSAERHVEMVTEAASHVYSHEKGDDYIKAQVVNANSWKRTSARKIESFDYFYIALHYTVQCIYNA